ncbi:MAG: hypothetical protein ACYC9D_12450 [Candidatus Dormibacteria bacterium]
MWFLNKPPIGVDTNEWIFKKWFNNVWSMFQGLVFPNPSSTVAFTLGNNFFYPCNATSAAFTVTLPAAKNNIGKKYVVKKTDSSVNAVTVGVTGSDTIDGATTYILGSQYSSLYVESDGISNWWIVSEGISPQKIGIGVVTPATYTLDVNGTINIPFGGTITCGGQSLLSNSSANHYNNVYDASGNSALTLGGTIDPGNYYNNTNHTFRSIGGASVLATLNSQILYVYGNIATNIAGAGFQIKEGTNARMGVSTLVAGSVVVANTSVTANTRIFLTKQTSGTTTAPVEVSARTAGTSFTISTGSNTDTAVVAWLLIEPA